MILWKKGPETAAAQLISEILYMWEKLISIHILNMNIQGGPYGRGQCFVYIKLINCAASPNVGGAGGQTQFHNLEYDR